MSRHRHCSSSNFAALLQEFFVERLMQQRAVSPQTIASYRDTFRLFLQFAQARLRKSPVDLALADINVDLTVFSNSGLSLERPGIGNAKRVDPL